MKKLFIYLNVNYVIKKNNLNSFIPNVLVLKQTIASNDFDTK